jgi:hypothetical protein
MSWIEEEFESKVALAQTEYLDYMRKMRLHVDAGDITEREYWEISEGPMLLRCGIKIQEATAWYDKQIKGR